MPNDQGVLLRMAAPEDAALIVALTQAAYRANQEKTGLYFYVYNETAQSLSDAMAQQKLMVLILERAGEAVGCVRISAADPQRMNLWRLGIHPDAQGHGLGRLMIDAVERWAAAWGRPWVTLGALEASPENRRLYEGLGYVAFDRIEMPSAPGNFYTLLRKPIALPAPDATVAAYEATGARWAADRTVQYRFTPEARACFQVLVPPPARVLDLGCGPGYDIDYLREAGYAVIGMDRTPVMLALATKTAAPLVRGDGRALPFANQSFDGIWANASLLHLPRLELVVALAEIRRLLRPGGGLYLNMKQGAGEKTSEGRFFAFYQPDELDHALRGAGLRPCEQWITAGRSATMPNWITIVARADAPDAGAGSTSVQRIAQASSTTEE